MSKLKEYAETFPEEIRLAVRAIDHETRYGIVSCLLENGDLSFTELCKHLEIRKNVLSYHLDKLMIGALVTNYSKEEFKPAYDSYYSITSFGKDWLEALLNPLYPFKHSLDTKIEIGAAKGWKITEIDHGESQDASSGMELPQKEVSA